MCHQIGSLLQILNEAPKFFQIYFMGDEEEQVNIRWHYNHIEAMQECATVKSLETGNIFGAKKQFNYSNLFIHQNAK